MQSRRNFIRGGGWLMGAAASGLAGEALSARSAMAPMSASSRLLSTESYVDGRDPSLLTRIAFGSCLHQDKEQRIWNAVLAAQPDLFLFLGDSIYGDTRDITHLRDQYGKLAANRHFQRLRARVPTMAIWDDHDYGENDAGIAYPLKEQSRAAFLEFWREPRHSPRWSRSGIYTARIYGPVGRRVQIIMPDLRFSRTPLTLLDIGPQRYEEWKATRRERGQQIPGPYARCAERGATMLGDEQWRWFEQQLDEPAEVRIIASSLQVLADFPGWEAWINYACDHQRLIDVLRRKQASGVLFVSGDTHYAELSRLDVNVPYPLWDMTCSGLTEIWDTDVPNANRVGKIVREENFGLIEIDWTVEDPVIQLKACDRFATPKIEQSVRLSQLTASANESRFEAISTLS